MSINWISAFNRLFPILDRGGETYYSGSNFIRMVQQVEIGIPDYHIYIEQRNKAGKSTTRRHFYWDIIDSLSEEQKYDLFRLFIESLEPHAREEMNDLRNFIFGNSSPVPRAKIPPELWNSEKLSRSLTEIDRAIESDQHNRAVTLAYSCLEGAYKAYLQRNIASYAEHK